MKLLLGCCSLVLLGMAGCGGDSGSTTVTGTDSASLRVSPAGVSTLVFMDLELVRPDMLANPSGLPGTVSASPGAAPAIRPEVSPTLTSPVTLTYSNTPAANGGLINGTVTVAWATAGGTTTYTETFNGLTVAATVQENGQSATQTWVYTGVQQVAVTGTSAVLTVPGSFSAAFSDSLVPAAARTWTFTVPTPLHVVWDSPLTTISMTGEYAFSTPSVGTVSVTILPALSWTQGVCRYPDAGTLTLALASATPGNDATTTVTFDATCGQVTLGGATLTLGSTN